MSEHLPKPQIRARLERALTPLTESGTPVTYLYELGEGETTIGIRVAGEQTFERTRTIPNGEQPWEAWAELTESVERIARQREPQWFEEP